MNSKKIHIAIVDDHSLLLHGLSSLLQDVPDVSIVSLLSSGEEAVNLPSAVRVDVFLMDIVMRGMTGIEATRWIKENQPNAKVILISSEISKEFISGGIQAGTDGYLPKDVTKEELVSAIRKVMKGEKYFNSAVTSLVFEDFYLKKTEGKGLPEKKSGLLTRREQEVLAKIANGKSLKAIAEELFISIKTVETHKLNIQQKLNLENTAQLVRYAIDNKMV